MSRVLVVVCLVALVGAQQQNASEPNQQQPTFQMPDFSGMMGQAGAAIGALQAQKEFSSRYANTILEFQAASNWMQVANSWSMQTMAAMKGAQNAQDLEEEDDDSSNGQQKLQPLEKVFPYTMLEQSNGDWSASENLNKVELQGEYAILFLTKLWHIQAAQKLGDAQRTHYQSKIQMMMLQGVPQASYLVYMTYYRDILNTIGSMYTIQKQDAWSWWVFIDIMETLTDVSSNSEYQRTLATAQHSAMQTYFMEAYVDFQIMYIDFFMQSMLGQAAQQPQQAAAQNSFLEVETEAQPEKPFFPFMFGGGNPYYFMYYTYMLRFYTRILNFHLAHTLFSSAQMELMSLQSDDSSKSSQLARTSRITFAYSAVPMMYQWAQMRMFTAMFDLYGLMSAMYGGQGMAHNAAHAAFSDLLQTDAPQTQPQASEETAQPAHTEEAPAAQPAPATPQSLLG